MDMEKVIKGLEHCLTIDSPCGDCPYYSYEDIQELECERNLRHDAIALLKEHGWIPITERLPKDDTDILVYCTDGEESRIVAVNYANGVWFDCVFNTVMVVENITHWMPLPKPPKEGR